MLTISTPEAHGVRLLGIEDIAAMTGLCPVSSSRLMDETGAVIRLRRRKYVLEDSFLSYLRSLEEAGNE